MHRRTTTRNGKESILLIGVVVALAVLSGYMVSKYVAVPMMVSYRQTVDNTQETKTLENSDAQIVTGNQNIPEASVQQTGDRLEEQGKKASTKGQGQKTQSEQNKEAASEQNKGIKSEQGKETIPSTKADKSAHGATNTPAKEDPAEGELLRGLYCIQFGSFTTRNAAETTLTQLSSKNIAAFIKEKEGVFKVFSIPYDTREKAKNAAGTLMGEVADLFVVEMK